nr:hypothetical protein CFP56_32598 [Quercus suber]
MVSEILLQQILEQGVGPNTKPINQGSRKRGHVITVLFSFITQLYGPAYANKAWKEIASLSLHTKSHADGVQLICL